MKKLNMMKKITLAFGVVIVCFIIALVFNVLGMINTANKYSTFYTMRHEATMRARNPHQCAEYDQECAVWNCGGRRVLY